MSEPNRFTSQSNTASLEKAKPLDVRSFEGQ